MVARRFGVRLGPPGSRIGRGPRDKEATISQLLQADPVPDEGTALSASATTAPERTQKTEPDYAREEADPTSDISPADRLRLRLDEAYATARELHAAATFAERIDIYNYRGKQIVYLAAANFRDLMPRLNGEFEFLELTRADHD
jgi:hypothetical protein